MRIAILALVLAILVPFVSGQDTASQRTTTTSGTVPRDPWAVVSKKPLPKGYKLKQPDNAQQAQALSADAFSLLFAGTEKPSLRACRVWIRAAATITTETRSELEPGLYEQVPFLLRNCVEDYPGLTPLELRRAVQAIYRFDQEEIDLFHTSNAGQRRQLNALQGEVDSAKHQVEEITAKYNGLDVLYKQMHSDYESLWNSSNALVSKYNDLSRSYVSSTYQMFIEGVELGRRQQASYAPLPQPPQPTHCTASLVGYDLKITCDK